MQIAFQLQKRLREVVSLGDEFPPFSDVRFQKSVIFLMDENPLKRDRLHKKFNIIKIKKSKVSQYFFWNYKKELHEMI